MGFKPRVFGHCTISRVKWKNVNVEPVDLTKLHSVEIPFDCLLPDEPLKVCNGFVCCPHQPRAFGNVLPGHKTSLVRNINFCVRMSSNFTTKIAMTTVVCFTLSFYLYLCVSYFNFNRKGLVQIISLKQGKQAVIFCKFFIVKVKKNFRNINKLL